MKLVFARKYSGDGNTVAMYGRSAYYTPDYTLQVYKQKRYDGNDTWYIGCVSGYTTTAMRNALHGSGLESVQFPTRRDAAASLEAFLQSLAVN